MIDEIPSITKQVEDIRLERGYDRCDPPSPYFVYLKDILSKQDIYRITQYIKRTLDANGH